MMTWMDTPELGQGRDTCVRGMRFNNAYIFEGKEEANPRDI